MMLVMLGYWGSFEAPAGHTFSHPDVTARGGQGIGVTFSEEAGAFDPVWYNVRTGYPYAPWNTVQINEHDTGTAYPTTVEWLPSSEGQNHGVVYLDNSPWCLL